LPNVGRLWGVEGKRLTNRRSRFREPSDWFSIMKACKPYRRSPGSLVVIHQQVAVGAGARPSSRARSREGPGSGASVGAEVKTEYRPYKPG
jgi:hypothetical protein